MSESTTTTTGTEINEETEVVQLIQRWVEITHSLLLILVIAADEKLEGQTDLKKMQQPRATSKELYHGGKQLDVSDNIKSWLKKRREFLANYNEKLYWRAADKKIDDATGVDEKMKHGWKSFDRATNAIRTTDNFDKAKNKWEELWKKESGKDGILYQLDNYSIYGNTAKTLKEKFLKHTKPTFSMIFNPGEKGSAWRDVVQNKEYYVKSRLATVDKTEVKKEDLLREFNFGYGRSTRTHKIPITSSSFKKGENMHLYHYIKDLRDGARPPPRRPPLLNWNDWVRTLFIAEFLWDEYSQGNQTLRHAQRLNTSGWHYEIKTMNFQPNTKEIVDVTGREAQKIYENYALLNKISHLFRWGANIYKNIPTVEPVKSNEHFAQKLPIELRMKYLYLSNNGQYKPQGKDTCVICPKIVTGLIDKSVVPLYNVDAKNFHFVNIKSDSGYYFDNLTGGKRKRRKTRRKSRRKTRKRKKKSRKQTKRGRKKTNKKRRR
tara:strand:+ start:417 stop:1889 length:1473 start_codon:yes stop_codon:yes gene_type:complete